SGSTTGQTVSVVAGSLCNNTFTLTLTVTLNSCTRTCTQSFTVVDNTAPTIGSAGANATVTCPATPTFSAPTATDGCSTATVQLVSDVTTAGACAAAYTETRIWKAVDACGNQSGTVSQSITVRDNTPPSIGSAGGNATI